MEQHFPWISGKKGNLARNTQNFENFRSATGPFKTMIIILRVFLVKKKKVEISNKWEFLDVEWAFKYFIYFKLWLILDSRDSICPTLFCETQENL